MDFSLSQEQQLLQDSVQRYVRDQATVESHRRLRHTELGFDPANWVQFAELGWLSVPFAEADGGLGGSLVDTMVVAEALGAGVVREPYLVGALSCGNILHLAPASAQRSAWINSVMDGSQQWAFAFAEQASGYNLARINTTAQPLETGYSLSGHKFAVLNGHCADQLIVSAQSEQGVGLFVVPATDKAVQRKVFTAIDGSKGAELTFDNVQLGDANVLVHPGTGLAVMQQAIDRTIVAMGAEAVGAMQSLLDTTVSYTRTREQFGQPIGKFQVLQHRMADMYLLLEETRSLLYNAAILHDRADTGAARASAALKVKLVEAGRYVSQQAVQLHGGMGMTDELIVGHHFKRLLLLSMLYGDQDTYLQRYIDLG